MSVRTERQDRVLVIRIDRESKRNAIDASVTRGLDAALNDLEDDPALRVGVLTGTQRVFSAGTDLRDGSGEPTVRGGEYGLMRRRRTKPLIAAVEGPAFGGGFELALACDLVVAGTSARFALPETRRGLVATSGALFRALRALPLHVAKELLVAGTELDAERAFQLGLVNRVCDAGEALSGALQLAASIVEGGPVATAATLGAIEHQLAQADEIGWAATAAALQAIMAGPEASEGIASFLGRRQPSWVAER